MSEWLNSNSSVFIAFLSPVLVAIGYLFRSRREIVKHRKLALYSLLEIWYRISTIVMFDVKNIMDIILCEIHEQYPFISFSDKEKNEMVKVITPIANGLMQGIVNCDIDSFHNIYSDTIKLIASSDPVLAYKISSVNKIKDSCSSIDQCIKQLREASEDGTNSDELLDYEGLLSQKLDDESIAYLERAIKSISIRIGFFTFLKTKQILRRRKNQLQERTETEAREIVDSVIKPSIEVSISKAQERDRIKQ